MTTYYIIAAAIAIIIPTTFYVVELIRSRKAVKHIMRCFPDPFPDPDIEKIVAAEEHELKRYFVEVCGYVTKLNLSSQEAVNLWKEHGKYVGSCFLSSDWYTAQRFYKLCIEHNITFSK